MNKDKMETPQILLFDCDDLVADELEKNNYNYSRATLGEQLRVKRAFPEDSFVVLSMEYPSNMHEFDIFIIDMKGRKIDQEISDDMTTTAPFLVKIKYPNECFFASTASVESIKNEFPEKGVYIMFLSEKVEVGYDYYSVNTNNRLSLAGQIQSCNYDLLEALSIGYLNFDEKTGKKITLSETETIFSDILKKHIKSMRYNAVFDVPVIWDNGKKIPDDRFLPLLLNQDGEIISFVYNDLERTLIALPQLEHKSKLIIRLLNEALSGLFPHKFPCLTQFNWINDENYLFPNEKKFREEINIETQKHKTIIAAIKEKIDKNKKKYSFLHDLLTETGTPLVKSVIKYLDWVGFTKVINTDEATIELKEDIDVFDVFDGNNLFIIEVKGIGGTSTDAECSQISKHRRKKEKEYLDLNIFALYIVNSQRYLPPPQRENPPFTDNQIDYAIDDERGLTTTYQLYKWYNLCEKGILSKEEVRKQFLSFGNIPLLPQNYHCLGKIEEYFEKHNAFILSIDNTQLEIGDELVFNKGNDWFISSITNIKINDEDVQMIDSGEVGIAIKEKISKGYEVYKKIPLSS